MLLLKLSQNRYNINIQSYSIKLSRNNFITLLHLYKSLNYESSSMRNDRYILKNNARCRLRFVIIITKKKLSEQRGIIEH